METNEEKISVYNDAMGQINRLNGIWIKCNSLSNKGDFIRWNHQLDIAYRELHSDIIEFKLMDEDVNYRAINKAITKHNKNRNKMYVLLASKETLLRRVQDLVGKGAKREEKYDSLM